MPDHMAEVEQRLLHVERLAEQSGGRDLAIPIILKTAEIHALLAIAADFREMVAALARIQAEGVRAIINALAPATMKPPADYEETLERATELAERHGEAIGRISELLAPSMTMTPEGRIRCAQTIIAGLAEPEPIRDYPHGSAGLCMATLNPRPGAPIEYCHFPDGHKGPHSWTDTLGAIK